MRRIAASILGVAEDYVQSAGATFFVGEEPAEESVGFAEVAYQAHQAGALPPLEEPGLEATRAFEPAEGSHVVGAQVCLVTVDPETGEARVEKHFAAHDLGVVLDPAGAERRIRANVLRGLAVALGPERAGTEEGGPCARAPAWPVRVPAMGCRLLRTPSGANPLGARGAGDAGLAGAIAAVANAVADAVADAVAGAAADAAAEGLPVALPVDLPLVPERLWRCLSTPREGAAERGGAT
jgi:carbon-monoxide dehydrogenase large subunit